MGQLTATRATSSATSRTVLGAHIGNECNWLIIMAGLTAIEFAWWALEWHIGRAPVPLIATYLLIAFGGLAAAVVLRIVLRKTPSDAPWMAIAAGTILVAIGASLFLPLKYAIPSELPFWLDPPLAAAERTIFRLDPWLILDRLFGRATRPLDLIYGLWMPVQLLAMFLVMLTRPSPTKSRALIAYSLAWFLLGTVAALLLSSTGPLFYDREFGGDTFKGLNQTLQKRGALIALNESNRMWQSRISSNPDLVAGISAMPSLHVAISLWMFLTVRAIVPRAAIAAFIYVVVVWVGSVQLGWHYASDGLVGALGMIGLWKLSLIPERLLRSWNELPPNLAA